MAMRRTLLWLVIATVAGLIWAKWLPRQFASQPDGGAGGGARVVLFRGDDSAGCRTINRLVDEAETQYAGRVGVTRVDWSPDHPLIREHNVRFLPTVVFLDSRGREKKRVVGESAAVQAELRQALSDAETLLRD